MCVLDMTDDQLRTGDLGRALLREDKPSEWCWGAKGTLGAGGGLSAACLQQVLLGPEIKVGWESGCEG